MLLQVNKSDATDQIKSRNFASSRKASVKLRVKLVSNLEHFGARSQLLHRESADRPNQLSVALLPLKNTRLKARG